uniref:NADH-ubiquinone oxidoreductase chain 4L n=1 Tax=Tetrabrachium ocellatum TaxID=242972 RepID=D3KRE1_TETOC|nr:NADH dehydrogenase subunit 4L [Tetrabrachium ocellatum]
MVWPLFLISCTFMFCLMGLVFNRAHFLSALLCLEGMMLSLFVALVLWMAQLTVTSFSAAPLYMLTMSACEAGTGLALMVATARTHGSDHLQSFNLLQC